MASDLNRKLATFFIFTTKERMENKMKADDIMAKAELQFKKAKAKYEDSIRKANEVRGKVEESRNFLSVDLAITVFCIHWMAYSNMGMY